jgi:hypothetical protein
MQSVHEVALLCAVGPDRTPNKLSQCAEPYCPATSPSAYTHFEGHHHLHFPLDPVARRQFESRMKGLTCEDNPFNHEDHPTSNAFARTSKALATQLKPESKEKDLLK